MSGERINNELRNNGIAGGVFSFSLNDILNGNNNNTNNNNNNTTDNNNDNNNTNRIPGLLPNIQFSSLGDTIANSIQNANRNNQNQNQNQAQGQGQAPDLASIITNIVQSFNNVVTDPHINHRRATQQALEALTPLHLSEIPEDERSNCPICYEPYVEYNPEAISSNNTNTNTNTNSNNENNNNEINDDTNNTANDNILNEILVGPWKGFELSDPSISFPAIETATYQHAYSLATEPDLGLIIDESNDATNDNDDNNNNNDNNNNLENDKHYAVKLPQCNHIFGRPCIVEWLNNNISCPLCRREILPEFTEDSRVPHDNNNINNLSNNNDNDNQRTFVYDRAITETYVPVDWTAPLSAGYVLSDPPLTLPVPGVGISSGRRTGRDP